MSEVWVISDTHFGHSNTFEKFKNADGTPMRPFTSVEEMNEAMINNINSRVGKNDRVIHCGDVVMNKRWIAQVMPELNGTWELVIGNHDQYLLAQLAPHFKQMTAMKERAGMVFTHFPMHPDSVERFGTNVHGHLHNGKVMWNHGAKAVRYIDPDTFEPKIVSKDNYNVEMTEADLQQPDPRYLCVCVEHTNYAPLHIEEVRQRIKDQQEAAGYVPKSSWGSGSGPS